MNAPDISSNNKMLFFIRAKHWQLFLLIIIPILWSDRFPFATIIRSIGALTFLCWLASVGFYGTYIINKRYFKRANGLFFFCLLLAPIFAAAYIIYCFPFDLAPDMIGTYNPFFGLIINIGLGFTTIYVFCYVAKTIAILEKQRNVTLSEWIKYPVLIMFYIFGVWMIQPKVNKWLAD